MNIKKMLPFLDSDDLLEVARGVVDGLEKYEDISLISLLPFMDEDDVDEIAVDVYQKEGSIQAILPFVSEEKAGELARIAVEREDDIDLTAIVPFMDEDDIDEVFLELARQGKNDTALYPFVSEDGWHEVLEAYIDGEIDFNFDEAYPFMDEDDIRDLFKYELRKHRNRM